MKFDHLYTKALSCLLFFCFQASLGVLKDRLFTAQYPSHLATATAPPPFPFQRIDVQAEPLPQVQTQTQVSGGGEQRQRQRQGAKTRE